jgi:hypothetical protein
MDEHGRRAARVDDVRVVDEALHDWPEGRRLGIHVAEGKAGGLGRGRPVPWLLEEDVVCLGDEDVLLGKALGKLLEELRDAVRPVHHREAHVARVFGARAAA